jgi:hypothetical protein
MKSKILLMSLVMGMLSVAYSDPKVYAADPSVIKTAGEVFYKGSIDGKRLFLVLGVQDGTKISQDLIKDAVDPQLFLDTASTFYNKKHEKDIFYAFGLSYKGGRESFPEILNLPWGSLKKIPQAFRVNIDSANEAYYNAPHPVIGTMKYSGLAVWTVVEGSYYLVIETPMNMLRGCAEVGWSAACPLLQQTWNVAWNTGALAFRTAALPTAALATTSYSVASSSLAAIATLIASGQTATYNGVKWLVYDLPRSYFYPIKVELKTELKLNQQEITANWIVQKIQNDGKYNAVARIAKFNSEIKAVSTANSHPKADFVYSVYPVAGKLILRAEVSRSHFEKTVQSESNDKTRAQVQKDFEAQLQDTLNQWAESSTPSP